MQNTTRGVLAEFLVATALGAHDRPREDWENYDLETSVNGRPITIEVKSSAERQSWEGEPRSFHKFDIGKTEDSYGKRPGKRRWSDVFVFCILKNRDATNQAEALDTGNWVFLILPADTLDRERPTRRVFVKGRFMNLARYQAAMLAWPTRLLRWRGC